MNRPAGTAHGDMNTQRAKSRGHGAGMLARARQQNPPSGLSLLTPHSALATPHSVAVCIGCGCTDNRACIDQTFGTPCSWLKVDRKLLIGVCSHCEHKLEEFERRVRNAECGVRSETRSALERNCSAPEVEE